MSSAKELRRASLAAMMAGRQARAFATSTTDDARRFTEADRDSDQRLDFAEFYSMQPRAVLDRFSAKQVREMFDAADVNGDGVLSINEFFFYSLGNAMSSKGKHTLTATFETYDTDGHGTLDRIEFRKACNDLGFGSVADVLFDELDKDCSSTIAYDELLDAATSIGKRDSSIDNRLFLTAFANTAAAGKEAHHLSVKKHIDTSSWRLQGKDMDSVRAELRKTLVDNNLQVGDAMRLFDEDGRANVAGPLHLSIDRGEFERAMRQTFGFSGRQATLDDIFKSLDTNGSGELGFDEGAPHVLACVFVHILPRVYAWYPFLPAMKSSHRPPPPQCSCLCIRRSRLTVAQSSSLSTAVATR